MAFSPRSLPHVQSFETPPPRDYSPGSPNFFTRSQSPGSLEWYWVFYVRILEHAMTCFQTHRNKPHATSPFLLIFMF